MPLYKDTITKDVVLAVKGFTQIRWEVSKADLKAIQDPTLRNDMLMQKQVMSQILASKSLQEVLAKTDIGALVLAIESGQDPSKVVPPGKKFPVTDENGRKGFAALPKEWQQSLCMMYNRGIDRVPVLKDADISKLDTILNNDPVVKSTQEPLNSAESSTFLQMMKTANVAVVDKNDPTPGALAHQDQVVTQTMESIDKSVYGPLPDLAGADLDPRIAEVTSEYGPAPVLNPGGGGTGGDPDTTGDPSGV
jgi:hypothetical protein